MIHEDLCIFIISHSILRIREVSCRSCTENQHTLYVPHLSQKPYGEIMWNSMVQHDRPNMKIEYGVYVVN
jgi:hypothetical protein